MCASVRFLLRKKTFAMAQISGVCPHLFSILGMSNISNVMLRERGEVAEWARDVTAMEYG